MALKAGFQKDGDDSSRQKRDSIAMAARSKVQDKSNIKTELSKNVSAMGDRTEVLYESSVIESRLVNVYTTAE